MFIDHLLIANHCEIHQLLLRGGPYYWIKTISLSDAYSVELPG